MVALGIEIDGGWIDGTHARWGGRIFEDRATYSAYHCCCGAKPKWKAKKKDFGGYGPLVRFPLRVKKEPPNLSSTSNGDSLINCESSDVVN